MTLKIVVPRPRLAPALVSITLHLLLLAFPPIFSNRHLWLRRSTLRLHSHLFIKSISLCHLKMNNTIRSNTNHGNLEWSPMNQVELLIGTVPTHHYQSWYLRLTIDHNVPESHIWIWKFNFCQPTLQSLKSRMALLVHKHNQKG